MSFDNTKYDIELNAIPHRIKGYQKSEAPSFVPRVAQGGQSETEFNLLLSKTLKSFEGGTLQRFWKDENSVFATEGLYPVYDDGVLYPVNPFTAGTLTGKSIVTAKCVSPGYSAYATTYLFYAYQSYNTPTNFLKRRYPNGTTDTITVPANFSDGNYRVTDMVVWRRQIWIVSSNAAGLGRLFYMNNTDSSLTEVTGGSSMAGQRLVVWNDQLYFTQVGIAANAGLYRYTGDTSSKSGVLAGLTPGQAADTDARLFVFNNRIMLARIDGLYAYDGTRLVAVEDLTSSPDEQNFRMACVMRGYMYYFMPDGMYRFNGSLIEKLYDKSEIATPTDMFVGKNRLWIIYNNSSSSSSRYDKSMGYDLGSGFSADGRVMVFNGKALYTYGRTSAFTKNPATIDFNAQGENVSGIYFAGTLFIFTNYDKSSQEVHTVSVDEVANTGNKSWRLITSIFDADFAMVDKNLENLELVLDGTVASDQSITIEYRTTGFEASTGWATLGTFSTQTELKRYIWKSIAAGISFKRIQFRLSGTTAATYGLSKLVVRYTLAPDFKWQWQFTVLAYGDDPVAPLQLADGTSGSQTVRALRGNIYAARSSDIPVKFVDLDQLDLSGAINSAVTTVVVNSTSLLKGDDGFIQIDDEIMYWYAKTSTNLTVVRGVLGTSAASHSDNAKVFIVYRVLVTQISNERVIMPDDGRRSTEDVDYPTELTLVVREV